MAKGVFYLLVVITKTPLCASNQREKQMKGKVKGEPVIFERIYEFVFRIFWLLLIECSIFSITFI